MPLNNLKAQFAQSQTDLVKMSLDSDTMRDEFVKDHALTINGWYTIDPESEDRSFRRLDQEEIEQAVKCLFQMRPTARIIDVKPAYGTIQEVAVMQNNEAGYRMTIQEKARAIASQFSRNYNVQGFRYELSNLEKTDAPATVSLVMYLVEESASVDFIPVSVFFRWRKNF